MLSSMFVFSMFDFFQLEIDKFLIQQFVLFKIRNISRLAKYVPEHIAPEHTLLIY